MKLINIFVILCLIASYSSANLKLVLKNKNTSQLISAQTSSEPDTSQDTQTALTTQSPSTLTISTPTDQDVDDTVIYITFIEGSYEIYGYCTSICGPDDEPVLYTEVTTFPDFGDIYRCQCGPNYSSWYDLNTQEELSLDILLGDYLFNSYINMVGYDDSECECSALKNLLYRLINS